MALVPGLGAGSRPVPVATTYQDSWMQGIGSTTSSPSIVTAPQMETSPAFTQYSSWRRVVDAFRQGRISYNEAYNILVTQFDYSGSEATKLLEDPSTETTEFEEESLTPVSEPEISDTSDDDTPSPSEPLFDNFELIGFLAIVGAVWLFAKQG